MWVGRFREDVIGTDEKTRRIERSVVLGTKADLPTKHLAERRLDSVLARINAPSYRPGRIATVEEFAERWRDAVLIQHKPSSQRVANVHLRRFVLPRLGKLHLDQLGREVQQGFLTWLSQTASRKYALNILGTLSSMLKTAHAWGYVCETVDYSTLALPEADVRRPAQFFSAEQARNIIATASEPFRALFTVALMTGMRSGELFGLQRGDLDFERRLIFIRRSIWRKRVQTPKSKHSARPVPMPESLAEVLQEHLAAQKPNSEGWLFANRFGRPLDAERIVRKRLRPILDALGIPRCGLHAFRHTHSSILLDIGAPATVVRDQMRHSDVRTTLGIYGHALVDAQRTAVEKVARILRPVAPKTEVIGQWIH